jgi:hypothetical protein
VFKNALKILVGKPEDRRPLGRPRHRWIILDWILNKYGGKGWTGFACLRIGTSGRFSEHGNEPLGYKEQKKFLD